MLRILLCVTMCLMMVCCHKADIVIKVTDKVINSDYIGNGAEWDPYDEAISWGSDISEEDWNVLFERIDPMGMGYVRCMVNSPFLYWDAASGTYDKTRNVEKISRILQYCKDNDITVVYGEFNPPEPSMKDSQRWVEMSVNYLDYLVNELGFDCIKHFVIFNEPDGDWATTDGDYELWKEMALRFDAEMGRYPGLKDKVSIAAPDAVVHWVHPDTGMNAADWMSRTASEIDDIVGIYDVHAYPGQTEVRDGSYAQKLRALKTFVPEGKRIILGEAGFKYENPEDSLMLKENFRRADEHPFAGGIDSNMMVYDHFYGLDMALLAMDVMNEGYSGMAVWMLDDAAHSVGDTGRKDNIKVWGFWNILGEEAFGIPSEEDIRPWYWAWSLMCRYFPKGCHINAVEVAGSGEMRVCAAEAGEGHTVAMVNWSSEDMAVSLELPYTFSDASVYVYDEAAGYLDAQGNMVPSAVGVSGNAVFINVPAQSLAIITDMQ